MLYYGKMSDRGLYSDDDGHSIDRVLAASTHLSTGPVVQFSARYTFFLLALNSFDIVW